MKPQQEKLGNCAESRTMESCAKPIGQYSDDFYHERLLVLKFKNDPKNYDKIMDEFSPEITAYLTRLTKNEDVADDLAQQTFLKAFDRVLKFEWRGISVAAYFYQIARNEFNAWWNTNDKYQKCKSTIAKLDQDSIGETDENILRQNAVQVLDSCLSTLSMQRQEIFDLFYWRGLRTWEISIVLGMPEGTIKSHLQRGREALQVEMMDRNLDLSAFSGLFNSENGATEREFSGGNAVKFFKKGSLK